MKKTIVTKLTNSPSYLKKGNEWLATYFGCSPRTIRTIKGQLREVKRNYITSLA